MKNYFIKEGYTHRRDPIQYQDTVENGLIYQVDVYRYAAEKISNLRLATILDVGCGFGIKLNKYILPTGIAITGVDSQHAIEFCKTHYQFGRWFVDDIESPHADLGFPFDLIICADVIEHLADPDTLFKYLHRWSHSRTRFLLSTPDRDLRRGSQDTGPPGNPAHVREWNSEEFKKYLAFHDLDILDHRIVKLRHDTCTCQLVYCVRRMLCEAL